MSDLNMAFEDLDNARKREYEVEKKFTSVLNDEMRDTPIEDKDWAWYQKMRDIVFKCRKIRYNHTSCGHIKCYKDNDRFIKDCWVCPFGRENMAIDLAEHYNVSLEEAKMYADFVGMNNE